MPKFFAKGALVACLVLYASAEVVAVRPVIIMFYGEGLAKPVYITGSDDTMAVHDANNKTQIRASDLGDRKYLSVAMFWGPKYLAYLNGEPLTDLKPTDAGQHGRLYLATSTEPAVLLQTIPSTEPVPVPTDLKAFSWGGVLAKKDIDILVRSGVPVRRN